MTMDAQAKFINRYNQNNKGNWEFNFFQKKYEPNTEAKIKTSMRPDNCFNPKNVHQYITPPISKEDLILQKKIRGEYLSNADKIILQNCIDKKEEALKADLTAIKTHGISSKPTTKEGKTRVLLMILDKSLKLDNKKMVCNIYLRLKEDDFELTNELKQQFSKQLGEMEDIVNELDIIELQFTEFYSQMPPLNAKGFKKFDDWQVQVINNIDNNISTVVDAPTSAGKSVLSGYTTTKGKTLWVFPTDPLAWQMASYIELIIGSSVPIITKTYQSCPYRDEFIEILNRAPAITGTADSIVDYLPFIKNDFKWIIFDEIHMIGKPEGSAMEHIAKVFNNVPILALSATIGNSNDLVSWFQKLSPTLKIDKITCDKRFFNLETFYYDSNNDKFETIHPLAMVHTSNFEDKSILNKSLQPTPPTIWDLSKKLERVFDLGELNSDKYFNKLNRIELDQAYEYFSKLVNFMVDKYHSGYKEEITNIIDNYKHYNINNENIDIVKLAFRLKEDESTPAILFQKNTIACLDLARKFAQKVDQMEIDKYPRLIQERLKILKLAKRLDKKIKKKEEHKNEENKNTTQSRKETKQMMGTIKLKKDAYGHTSIQTQPEEIITTSIQEPHPDFNFNKQKIFYDDIVDQWAMELKQYFPNNGEYYHWIIRLLWRGVGVFAKGLPDPYLRLVQSLACKKQLALVFSDDSLVFGVSMPFQTAIIYHDNKLIDDLSPMMFKQMSGRAGRRGLDRKGKIIFVGYSFKRIKELSTSEKPLITGMNNIPYTIPQANKLSSLFNTNQNWENTCKNFLDKDILDEDANEFLEITKSNYEGGWNFAFSPEDKNHLQMCWRLRDSEVSVIISYLIPYLRRGFEGLDHVNKINQINIAHFLCRFICIKTTNNKEDMLIEPEILSNYPYNQILSKFEDLQIEIPNNIDNKLLLSIKNNKLVKTPYEDETNELRQRLLELSKTLIIIQHYCFHSKILGLSRLLGKLLTRIWWIYHTSSPITKSFIEYNTEDYETIQYSSDSNKESESEEDYEEDYEEDSE
jgi:hypothetical protein